MKAKYLMIAALATIMAACNNDDENVTNDGPVAAQVYAEINKATATRAAGMGWDANDVIGISTIEPTPATDAPKTKYANVPYIYKNENFAFDTTSGKEAIYFQDSREVSFCAYYPYESDLASDGIISNISTTNQTNQKDFDYLFATGATAQRTSPNLNFVNNSGGVDASFQHCMSQVSFEFEAGDGVLEDVLTDKLTNLVIYDVVNVGLFDTASGIATAKANPQKADKGITIVTVNNKSASVILFPQNAPIASNQFRIYLKLDGVNYVATLTLPTEIADGKFKAGVNVKYTITVQKTALTVYSAVISPWQETTGTGGPAIME